MESVFTKIIKRELPASIIYEDAAVIAFYDINPLGPGHFLVVPKNHSVNLLDINDEHAAYLFAKAIELARRVVREQNASGFNLVVNNGKAARQEVMHTHIHIIPAR